MAQSKKPKLSKQATRVLRSLKSGEGEAWDSDGDQKIVPRGGEASNIGAAYESRQALLSDLANLRDAQAIEWFWKKRRERFMPESSEDLVDLRDDLRVIWSLADIVHRRAPLSELKARDSEIFDIRIVFHGFHQDDPLAEVGAVRATDGILLDWLAWQPSAERIKEWIDTEWIDLSVTPNYRYLPFTCSVWEQMLLPEMCAIRPQLIQGVMEHWAYLRRCANSDCATPYFIAKRKDQTVCDAEQCKAEKQRQHALKWWLAHRAKRDRPTSGKTRIIDARKNRQHVPKKAR